MDHLLPILSEEEYAAEIELCDKAEDPDEVDNVIKRWLRLYLPALTPGELTQESLDIIKCRVTHTEIMTKLSRRYRRLMEDQKSSTNQLNVTASDTNTTHAEPSTSSSCATAPPAHSTSTPTFNPPPTTASSLPMQIPNLPTTSSSSVIAPPAHSTGAPTFNPLPLVASSLPMRIPNLPTTSSSSVIAPPAHCTGTPTFNPPPPVTSSLPMQIPNLPTTSSSSVIAPPAHSIGTPTFNPPLPVASSLPMQIPNLPPTDDCEYTVIGPNGTTVSTRVFQDISFKEPTVATRSLLCLVFTEEVLARNTLSGKPSPAFKGRERPLKGQLDPDKVSDVIHCIASRTDFTEKNVRTVITAKCSDSTKKIKKLKRKQE
ncbi:uncharacterized protein PB18E9.04c-like isoform X1 [Bactrocera tryoni]|uniref:uncharacterized protein PB18E9.04c-like isoform X1 n=1 Tax=Bactrocera tryoni TaxID=59916 RepID=UPI001A973328|nr:uncharacterized protein PB18E9.04c-like isoform X1 [Bactrocera tryoni]